MMMMAAVEPVQPLSALEQEMMTIPKLALLSSSSSSQPLSRSLLSEREDSSSSSAKLAEMQQQMEALQQQLNERDDCIHSLQHQLSESDQVMSVKHQEWAATQHELSSLQQERAQAEQKRLEAARLITMPSQSASPADLASQLESVLISNELLRAENEKLQVCFSANHSAQSIILSHCHFSSIVSVIRRLAVRCSSCSPRRR